MKWEELDQNGGIKSRGQGTGAFPIAFEQEGQIARGEETKTEAW